MALLLRTKETGPLGTILLGTDSTKKTMGIWGSVESSLHSDGDIGLQVINPEQVRAEKVSSDAVEVARDKNLAVQEVLAEKSLESAPYLVITADVNTAIIHGEERSRTELHRLNRIKQSDEFKTLDPESQASFLQNIYETERVRMISMACQGSFVIEWQVAFSLQSLDGKVNETHYAVVQAFFDPLNEDLVTSYFVTEDPQLEPLAMNFGPRLAWAELAREGNAKGAVIRTAETISPVNVADLYELVVECRMPHAMIAIVEAYFLNALETPVIN